MNILRSRTVVVSSAVELCVLFVLWVFWLSLGADVRVTRLCVVESLSYVPAQIAATGINSINCSALAERACCVP
jgi:hypothetical protein